ncbi:MAG TPA: succinate dehydrogenase assembly factor 2 [Caulobacteraceae bacterium]|nr:succinate dehydrogenase assembly factor 2 [Caulobacteraceae bacterium]
MDPRRKKLKYRAWHRGFVEADLILGPFADAHLEALGEADLDHLEILLEQADHDLYAWIIGQAEPPADLDVPVLALIRQFRFDARLARADASA